MFTNDASGPARLARQAFTALTLATFLVTTIGCSTWRVQPLTRLDYPDYQLVREKVRFHLDDGRVVTLEVMEVDYPLVRGWPLHESTPGPTDAVISFPQEGRPVAEVDCRHVTKLEISKSSGAATTVAVVTAVTVVAVLIAMIAASGDDEPHYSSTSTSSCPVLYVREGGTDHLIGEPYAGAAAKSIQRRDLLPVPLPLSGPTALRLTNEARETQSTDLARLVLVDHAPGIRALATHEQDVLTVGPARPALAAAALDGTDATPLVAEADSLWWETDLDGCVENPAFPLVEGMVVSFAPAGPGERPVLELEVGSTYWLDLVMNRFLALLGERFEPAMARAGREASGPRLREWLAREGVRLKVELRTADGWREIGSVSPVGPLAPRRVAVPVPAEAVPAAGPLTFRLSGGSGFWRLGQVAASAERLDAVASVRLQPRTATDGDGRDQLGLIAAADGRCQQLERVGDTLDLAFAVPPPAPGLARSAFFETSGYYVAHQPLRSERSLATFRTVVNEPGALARFSLDLYRQYRAIADRVPPRAALVTGAS